MSSSVGPSGNKAATLIGDSALLAAVTVFAAPASLVIGPAAAWWLHGRRFDKRAALAGGIGLVSAIVMVFALYFAVVGIGSAVGPVGGSEFGLGIALFAVVGAAFLAVLIALDVDAVRDLSPARRAHVRLDVVRLVATAIIVVVTPIVFAVQTANPGSEVGDIGPFALMAATIGAVTMWIGGVAYRRLERSGGAVGAAGGI